MEVNPALEKELYRPKADIRIKDGLTLELLPFLFPRDAATGEYSVSTSSIPGAAATYLAMPTPEPVRLEDREGYTTVTLALPMVGGIRDCKGTFVYYPPTAEDRLNHLLKDWFELDFYKYYARGMQYGYKKQDVVEMYLVSRGIMDNESWQTLHKRAYRRDLRILRDRTAQLKRKARYFFYEDPNNPQPKK